MRNQLRFSSLDEAERELKRLKTAKNIRCPGWNVCEICLHCAQTIEYSITGYPVMKPALLRNTIGKLAIKKFLRQGYMKHDLMAHVPGGTKIVATGDPLTCIETLLDTIQNFKNYEGELKPHLLFGRLSKSDYDKYFAMHIAEHLSELEYDLSPERS